MENKKNYIDGVDVSECEHYRAEIETKMPYGEYETQKDKCYYSGIEVIQNCKGNKGCIYKQLQRLKHQYADVLKLAKENADSNEFCLQELEKENERLKAELKKYEDMAKKGLEEFKDVGGCWGCGLQLQLNQDMETIKQLKEENKQLKKLKFKSDGIELLQDANLNLHNANVKYRKVLQEIMDIVSEPCIVDENCQTCNSGCMQKDILAKINEVIGAE